MLFLFIYISFTFIAKYYVLRLWHMLGLLFHYCMLNSLGKMREAVKISRVLGR